MFDTEKQLAAEKPSSVSIGEAGHSWTRAVATAAWSAKEAVKNSTWQEKAGMAAAVGMGIATIAITHGHGLREVGRVAKNAELTTEVQHLPFNKEVLAAAKGVEHFVFDLDSTLTDYYKASDVLRSTMTSELHAATGLPVEEVSKALSSTSRRLGSAYFYNDLNQIDGIRKYYPDADLNRKFASVSDAAGSAYHDALRARPDTVELFDFLKSKGKKIHVFTASPTTRALDKLTASGLEPYVDKIFTAGPQAFDDSAASRLLTAASPTHKVIPLDWDCKETGNGYSTVVEELGVGGRKIAMTGDNLKQDIKPARWFGMFTAQAKWFVQESSPAIKADVELDTPGAFKTLLEAAYKS